MWVLITQKTQCQHGHTLLFVRVNEVIILCELAVIFRRTHCLEILNVSVEFWNSYIYIRHVHQNMLLKSNDDVITLDTWRKYSSKRQTVMYIRKLIIVDYIHSACEFMKLALQKFPFRQSISFSRITKW